MAKTGLFKILRIAILLYVLLMVAGYSWLSRARMTDWNTPLHVGLYAINGDGSAASDHYISGLGDSEFQDVANFLSQEAHRHGVAIAAPAYMRVGEPVSDNPPEPPHGGNIIQIAVWSLQLRYWAWRHGKGLALAPNIKIFVRYFDPANYERLPHSVGLEKGHVGIVNVFASRKMSGSNNVVIAHELLHTLGASDKYNSETGLPIFPHGYAEPQRTPLLPQRKAEIMGGRLPLTETKAKIPQSLKSVLVGAATALEIGWIE